jgi:hypothetical protein
MATNVTQDEILDAMVSQLADKLVPDGSALTSEKPVRSVQRYMGSEFTVQNGFRQGIAGRCPALRVRYAGSRALKTHFGRRVDRIESNFSIVVVTDDESGKERRKTLLTLAEAVRKHVGSHRFALEINPMRWQRTDVLRDDEQMLAYAITFTTKHRVDYTVDPGEDVLESASGEITDEDGDRVFLETDAVFEESP